MSDMAAMARSRYCMVCIVVSVLDRRTGMPALLPDKDSAKSSVNVPPFRTLSVCGRRVRSKNKRRNGMSSRSSSSCMAAAFTLSFRLRGGWALSAAMWMFAQMFSSPTSRSMPALRSVSLTDGFTPERMTSMPSFREARMRLERLCSPVESMKGTLRMRMMRTFDFSPMVCITSSNLLAIPKKKGPSIS